MSYTVSQLLFDVLPRVGNTKPTGITIIGAANSITSLIFKKLLERRSDMLATGQMSYILPANGYSLTLPDDYISPAEKPYVVEVEGLIASLEAELATDGLTAPNQALVAALFTPGTGVLVSTIQAIVSTVADVQTIINNLMTTHNRHTLQPRYLDEDEHEDEGWWDWYGISGGSVSYAHSHTSKVINQTMYIHPKSVNDRTLRGRYFQRPANATTISSIVPFYGMFDEVYREGCTRALITGTASIDSDPAMAAFIHREVTTVLDSRVHNVRQNGRVARRNWT